MSFSYLNRAYFFPTGLPLAVKLALSHNAIYHTVFLIVFKYDDELAMFVLDYCQTQIS